MQLLPLLLTGWKSSPFWSPEGKTVALLVPKPGGKTALVLINVGTGNLKEIPLP